MRISALAFGCILCFSAGPASAEHPPFLSRFAEHSDQAALAWEEKVKRLEKITKELEQDVAALKQYAEAISHFPIPEAIDFCGKPVPLDRWYVRERLDRQLFLLSRERRQVVTWMKRSRKFFPSIENNLKKADRPLCQDLKYVSVVESSLVERAFSSARASGIWQFILSTGRIFNLFYSDAVDDRRNFEKATGAALSYLAKLHGEFRDWPLALAAYNSGEVKVRRLLREQNVTEYWDMVFEGRTGMPTETNEYVYKIIAVKLVFEYPERYGFFLNEKDFFTFPDMIESSLILKKRTPLVQVASELGVTLLELKELNPWLRNNYLGKGNWFLRIPQKK